MDCGTNSRLLLEHLDCGFESHLSPMYVCMYVWRLSVLMVFWVGRGVVPDVCKEDAEIRKNGSWVIGVCSTKNDLRFCLS